MPPLGNVPDPPWRECSPAHDDSAVQEYNGPSGCPPLLSPFIPLAFLTPFSVCVKTPDLDCRSYRGITSNRYKYTIQRISRLCHPSLPTTGLSSSTEAHFDKTKEIQEAQHSTAKRCMHFQVYVSLFVSVMHRWSGWQHQQELSSPHMSWTAEGSLSSQEKVSPHRRPPALRGNVAHHPNLAGNITAHMVHISKRKTSANIASYFEAKLTTVHPNPLDAGWPTPLSIVA